jgi:SAM-dependent methyltransferase
MIREARNTEASGGQFSGEPTKAFMDHMSKLIPPGIHFDLGCGSGIYLFEIWKRRKDIKLCGIEISKNRFNVANQIHKNAGSEVLIELGDICRMGPIPSTVTSLWMHDTVWTEDVIAASTKLVLENASIVTVVCVKSRPELISRGPFKLSETFQFCLRGQQTQRTALVYIRTQLQDVGAARDRVVQVTRAHFKEDIQSYKGETESDKKKDMEVRCRPHSPVASRVFIVGAAGESDPEQMGRWS